MGQIKNIKLHIVTDIKQTSIQHHTHTSSSMFICGAWVRRGIAKEQPDKVTLEEEDLKKLLDETSSKIKDLAGGGGEEINVNSDEQNDEEEEEDGEDVNSEEDGNMSDEIDDEEET